MTARDWAPDAGRPALELRASLLHRAREFFRERGVLEVETPILGHAAATDPHLDSVRVELASETLYLQTSPELSMKRLLAADVGPIFQIAKVFRAGEEGARHNPEFTLLEWYRPGFDHHRLMDEMDALLRVLLDLPGARRVSYESLFREHVGLDPHVSSAQALEEAYRGLDLPDVAGSDLTRVDWLHLLMTERIEPRLPAGAVFVYDYPAAMAALARLRPGDPAVAERFEVYVDGVELANGYHELADAAEQRRRFAADLDDRRRRGKDPVPLDERLLAALASGLPDCAGVALGFDRLVMLAAGATDIRDVLSFSLGRA